MLHTTKCNTTTALLAGLLAASAGHAETLSVPSAYPTIQSAIDAAQDGDVIQVAPGHYSINADFQGKAITLRSAGGAASTFLYPRAIGSPIINMRGPLSGRATLDGFTIAQGNATNGGALFMTGNTLLLNSTLDGNSADLGGAAFVSGNATFRNVTLTNNTAMHGGAIYAGPLAEITIDDSRLESNEAQLGGAIYSNATNFGNEATLILRSTLENNFADDGGAIFSLMRDLAVEGSELKNNDTTGSGGAAMIQEAVAYFYASEFNLNNADNTAGALGGMEFSALMAENCNFQENSAALGGALYATGDTTFELLGSSLCSNTGTPLVNVLDAGGNTLDCETPICMADVNEDGIISPPDFSSWLNAFYQRDERADQNEDGMINSMDFGSFLRNYHIGCP